MPTIEEAKVGLDHLRVHGESSFVFTFNESLPANTWLPRSRKSEFELDRCFSSLGGSNADCFVNGGNENLAISDGTRFRGLNNGTYSGFY